jgi:hypothetical protein
MAPSFIQVGGIYAGEDPTNWTGGWPTSAGYVCGRIRGDLMAIWNVDSIGMRYNRSGETCQLDTELVAVQVPQEPPNPFCPYDAAAYTGGTIQRAAVGAFAIAYDMELYGFTIASGQFQGAASVGFGATIGPIETDGIIFPADNGLGNAGGGQLWMGKWVDPADGVPLYVVIASGAIPNPAEVPAGWTLAGTGHFISAFTYLGSAPAPPAFGALSDIVTDVCERAGLTPDQIDVSLLTDANISGGSTVVDGYLIDRQSPAANVLKALMVAYFFDACETNGKLVFVPRGLAPKLTIPEADLGLMSDKGELLEQIAQEQDLPLSFTVIYPDPALDYQQNKQFKFRNTRIIKTRQQAVLNIPIVMDQDQAIQIAEKSLFLAWLERNTYLTNLWRAIYMRLDATDVIQFVYEGITFQVRLAETTLGTGFVVALSAVSDNSSTYSSTASGGGGSGGSGAGGGLQTSGPTLLFLFDLPLLRDTDSSPGNTGFYSAISSTTAGWQGGILYESSDDASFTQDEEETTPASFGYTPNALGAPAHSPWTWDTVNTITVKMQLGSFSGDTMANVLNGSNAILVGLEVIQFQNAVQNPDSTWTLSNLLRGRRGTEWAITEHEAGDLVVMLLAGGVDHNLEPLSRLDLLRYYRGVTVGQDITTVPSTDFTITGRDLMPYSPVQIGGYFSS